MYKLVALLTTAICLSASSTATATKPTDKTPNAAQTCKTQRTQLGTATFNATYGTNKNKSNAFGKCVSKARNAQTADDDVAKTQCTTEQADPNFAASHGAKTFAQYYGTNKNDKNAFGKCVSAKAAKAVTDRTADTVNAARACKTERAAGPAAFKAKYATNKNKTNAFGKCVSRSAKA